MTGLILANDVKEDNHWYLWRASNTITARVWWCFRFV